MWRLLLDYVKSISFVNLIHYLYRLFWDFLMQCLSFAWSMICFEPDFHSKDFSGWLFSVLLFLYQLLKYILLYLFYLNYFVYFIFPTKLKISLSLILVWIHCLTSFPLLTSIQWCKSDTCYISYTFMHVSSVA